MDRELVNVAEQTHFKKLPMARQTLPGNVAEARAENFRLGIAGADARVSDTVQIQNLLVRESQVHIG